MPTQNFLACDGCGQVASLEHIAKRLQRLEWTTRYRPVHINTAFLGAFAPRLDNEFLYSGGLDGEAGRLLDALQIPTEVKSAENGLADFQRGGFFLLHVLECPLETSTAPSRSEEALLRQRMPFLIARIRRSLRPKRIALISEALNPFVDILAGAELYCTLMLDEGKPFPLDASDPKQAVLRLRMALMSPVAAP